METYRRKTRMTRNEYRRRKFLEQKLMGIVMLIISGLFLAMVIETNEDAGAFLVMAPLGLFLLFSRKILIL